MTPLDRLNDAAKKAKEALDEYVKAHAECVKGGITPSAPAVGGSVGPTPDSTNPSGAHPGPSGPAIVSSSPKAPERKFSPEDPSYTGAPRDQAPNNLVHSSPSFSAKTPPSITPAAPPVSADGVKKSFFTAPDRPAYLDKTVHNGRLTIDPESTRTPNLVQKARMGMRKSRTCECGTTTDAAITVCPNCGRGPAVNSGFSLDAALVRRLVG